MFRKISLSLALVAVFSFTAVAQKNFFKEAEKAFGVKEYFGAIDLYKKAYIKEKKAEKKAKILFRTAECYRHINSIKEAESYYSKAIKANYPDPMSYYYIGEIKKEQMLYNEAISEFENYKKSNPSDPRAESQIKACELAQKWKDNPTRHKIENMALFNSKQEDFGPSFTDKKYTTLVFTSTREGSVGGHMDGTTGELHSDLFETKMDKNGKWSTPTDLGEPINSPVNEGTAVVSKKGDFMMFTRCEEQKNKKTRCHLYMAKKQGPSWAVPELVPFNVDSFNFAHPTLSPDGNTLYFASNMTGTYGSSDIWMSEFDKKAKTWGTPVNLGPAVNTDGQEMYPYMHNDGKTLYFSSNKHLGMGGLDIFRIEKDANGKFTKTPENLKYPLNSAFDDFGILYEGTKERGYFSSNREGGKGSDDIYSFVLPPLIFKAKGTVKSSKDQTVVPNCSIILKGSDGTLVQAKSDAKGEFLMELKPEVSYEVYTETDKNLKTPTAPLSFLASTDRGKFTTVGLQESQDFQKDFLLTPVEAEIKFPAVQYDLGKATLRKESEDSLNYLLKTLNDNPTIVIELSAHTDSRGSTASNDKLSQARAQSCVDYLISKGIPQARLVAKGYGERKLKITDAQIAKAKTKEEKEALHQLNRRTVFKILNWDFVDPTKPKVEIPKYHPPVKGEEDADKIETVDPDHQ
ncbi:MAG: OmpA family protein [Bacteroidia bacterium]